MGIHSPAKTSAMTLPQRSLATRFWINTLVGRWYYLSFWWEIRITLFPTNALVARRVLIAERQITSLFKPRKISSEQFMLISEGFKGRILLLTQKGLEATRENTKTDFQHRFGKVWRERSLRLKVLLRRNFDVMFITKNHLYQLINEDCHLKFDWNEPQTGKKLALKSFFFSRPPSWIYVPMSLRFRAAATRYWPIVFLWWRHFLNSHWSFLL